MMMRCIVVCFILPVLGAIRYEDIRDSKQHHRETPVHVEKPVLPLHRLSECPNQKDTFFYGKDCKLGNTDTISGNTPTWDYRCSWFRQMCFNKTVEIECRNYTRTCDVRNNCIESYDECQVHNFTQATKAPLPGVPAKVYAECIPGLTALRDQCFADLKDCKTVWSFDIETDSLTSCTISCFPYNMWCYNYTRVCEKETSEAYNISGRSSVSVSLKESNCTLKTIRRRDGFAMMWNASVVITDKKTGDRQIGGTVLVKEVFTEIWGKEEAWEECIAATQVPYNFECNLFIEHFMDQLKGVFYEPTAYKLTDGIRVFLEKWDGGYDVLCKWDCWYHLIKFSRVCWPYLPLQRFLPGADYRTLEIIFRNMTRILCFMSEPPLVEYTGVEKFKNAGNSCISFFDVENTITKPHYDNVTTHCLGPIRKEMCTKECTEALDGLSQRFGCCMGSISYQYNVSRDWLKLINFDNQPVIDKLHACNTYMVRQCELPYISALSIEIVRNLMYVLGVIMTFVVIVMTVSFYWQLEHEPLKKQFYHF